MSEGDGGEHGVRAVRQAMVMTRQASGGGRLEPRRLPATSRWRMQLQVRQIAAAFYAKSGAASPDLELLESKQPLGS